MVLRMPFSGPSGPAPGMGPMSAPPPDSASLLAPTAPPTPSPSMPDLLSLMDTAVKPSTQPIYPPGYKAPKKPKREAILTRAQVSKIAYGPYLDQIASTLRHIRPGPNQESGIFEVDEERIRNREMEPFKSTQLIDGWNRFTAFLAARPIAFTVDVYDPALYQDAQKIEDAAYYFRQKNERTWVERGNMSLAMAEAKDLTLYGMVVSRRVLDLTNTHCPLDAVLIDPATVFPVWGRAGAVKTLEAVYRLVRMPAQQVLADYFADDPPQKVLDALSQELSQAGENSVVELIEYWDTWWRGVFLCNSDVDIVPLTAHEYGCVPYIIQYGPGGEPMHTRSPNQSYTENGYGAAGMDIERVFKSSGFLESQKYAHHLREAFATKYLDAVVKGFEQPVIIETTADGADNYEFPEPDRRRNGVTYLKAGQERMLPFPTSAPGSDAGMLMQILTADAQSNLLAPGFDNTANVSNISGTARTSMAQEGREQHQGWIDALELFRGRCATHDIKLWRNFGHLSRYTSGKKKAFYIPRRNPSETEPKAFELTPEVVDNVDTDVTCVMSGLRLDELIPFANAAQMMNQLGVWDKRLIARKAGITDYDRIEQNIRTEQAIQKAQELPEFAKLITIPQALMAAIAAAEGNQALQEGLQAQLQIWMQAVAMPQQAQLSGGMGMGGPGGPPQGGPAGAPPGGPQPVGGIPGGTNTAAAAGQLPGSVTGQQGGPQGPIGGAQGGPPPPPPGSFRVQ